jgi:TonB family protein
MAAITRYREQSSLPSAKAVRTALILIVCLAVAMLTLASAFAETDVIPLPRPLVQATPKPQKVQDISQAKALAIYAPRPQYPYEARARHITGRGVAIVKVNPKTGLVTSAKMARSTGSPILDNATVSAFRQWRFQPGSVMTTLHIPIAFTMTGAQY